MVEPTGLPSVNDLGRNIGALDGNDLLIFVLLVIILIQVLDRWSSAVSMRAERKDMADERAKMWQVADKFGEAAKTIETGQNNVAAHLQVSSAIASRVESALGKCQEIIDQRKP